MPQADSRSLGSNLVWAGLLGLAVSAALAAAHFLFGMPMHARAMGRRISLQATAGAGSLSDAEIAAGLVIVAGVFTIFVVAGALLQLLKDGRRP